MPKRLFDLQKGQPLLDIASYGRRGPGARPSPHELELITYTARRTPEVVVKVSGGATSRRGALAHLQYIDRSGRLEIETDHGEIVKGKEAKDTLTEDWELDLLPRNPGHPAGAFPVASRRSSFTTSCCRCRQAPRRQSCWPRAGNLPGRNSH